MNVVLLILVGFIGGVITSVVIFQIKNRNLYVGTLRIDHSDPDSPYLFCELETDLNHLSKHSRVIMSVKNESYIPQQ